MEASVFKQLEQTQKIHVQFSGPTPKLLVY